MSSAAATSLRIIAAWLAAATVATAAPPIDPPPAEPSAAQVDTPPAALPTGNPKDRAISALPFSGRGPVIAVNPKATSRVVVGLVRSPISGRNVCVVRSSAHGGTSWAAAVRLPTSEQDFCESIDLAYAADGSRLFAAYTQHIGGDSRIAVATSDDDGGTWHASAALPWPGPRCARVMPKLATARDPGNRAIVYLAATSCVWSGNIEDSRVVFLRSTDAGTTWSAPRTLESAHYDSTKGGGMVWGPRPAEGAGGDLLVGWRFDNGVRMARSSDFGATFGAVSTPVSLTDGQILSFDLKVGFKSAAHLAYDQFWFDATREDIDIRYTWSAPPYATWSAPITVSDEINQRFQGFPALAVQACKGRTILHLAWTDTRLAPALNDGYDIFYAQKKAVSGANWSKNVRVSDRSSVAFDPVFIPPGGEMDLAVAGDTAIAVWPDRRGATFSFDDRHQSDVYVSRILTGTSCR